MQENAAQQKYLTYFTPPTNYILHKGVILHSHASYAIHIVCATNRFDKTRDPIPFNFNSPSARRALNPNCSLVPEQISLDCWADDLPLVRKRSELR